VFAAFAQLDWRDFGHWVAVKNPRYSPVALGHGFSGRPLFGVVAPFHSALTESVLAEGIHNPVCAIALGAQVCPTYGASRIAAARAAEARTGKPVLIPTIVSGPAGIPPALARRNWTEVPLRGDDKVFRALFRDPPQHVEIDPAGFLLFHGSLGEWDSVHQPGLRVGA
jgi:hypothetical protein